VGAMRHRAQEAAAVVFTFDPDSQVMRRAQCDPDLVAAYAADLAERGLEVAVYFPPEVAS
jgi:hypothetical protein